MQVPALIQEFLSWRWSPCVALTAGSLAFVVLAVALIPSQIDGEAPTSATLGSVVDRPRVPPAAMLNASLAQRPVMTERGTLDESSLRTRQQPTQALSPQRGFSPILERAEPVQTPPEAPPPPPVAPPPPAALAPAAPAPAEAAPAPPGAQETTEPPSTPDSDGPRRQN